jgi:hypothetical protein
MFRWMRTIAIALIAPMLLSSCVFLPGKFESALVIHADRSFSFSYKGEVAAIDVQTLMSKSMQGAMAPPPGKNDKKAKDAPPASPFDFTLTPEEKAKQDENFRKLAVEVAREAGYRTVEYRGNGIFYVDYQISGVLTHSFVYPYNLDNQMIWPWIAVELRGKDLVRVKAQGFARPDASGMGVGGMGSSMGAMPFAGIGDAVNRLDGTFTLTTDAELVSQNNEEGAATTGSTRTVTWKVSSTTKDAPMASIRVRPLP